MLKEKLPHEYKEKLERDKKYFEEMIDVHSSNLAEMRREKEKGELILQFILGGDLNVYVGVETHAALKAENDIENPILEGVYNLRQGLNFHDFHRPYSTFGYTDKEYQVLKAVIRRKVIKFAGEL